MTRRKIERWGRYGKVSVSRDERGRFVSWKRVVSDFFSYGYGEKRVAVYGYCFTDKGSSSRRYEFHGNGRELYQAVLQAHGLVPRKRFVTVSAEDFLDDPFEYGTGGYWINPPEVES
jgi:hypothetical protein